MCVQAEYTSVWILSNCLQKGGKSGSVLQNQTNHLPLKPIQNHPIHSGYLKVSRISTPKPCWHLTSSGYASNSQLFSLKKSATISCMRFLKMCTCFVLVLCSFSKCLLPNFKMNRFFWRKKKSQPFCLVCWCALEMCLCFLYSRCSVYSFWNLTSNYFDVMYHLNSYNFK